MIENLLSKIRDALIDHYGENLQAVVLFGSTASDKRGADIDLLVVIKDIKENRLKRIPEIVRLKRRLSAEVPLDILLVSKEECRANFKNHNPLYLDIAVEGKILFDRGFIEEEMASVQRYIEEKRLRRDEKTWFFPVAYRMATPLSPVNNQEWARVWLVDAERDIKIAHLLEKEGFYDKSIYHCQQATEKAIKAILICFGEFKKSHFVADALRNRVNEIEDGKWREKLLSLSEFGEEIEPQVSLSRYPGFDGEGLWIPAEKYGNEEAKDLIEKSESATKTAMGFVDWWFRKGNERIGG